MISDKADQSGKFLAEIGFSNKDKEKLKAGLLTEIHFRLPESETGLSIPVSALLASAKEARIFIVNGSKAEERLIKTGMITGDKVQVKEGLRAGEQVVISGQVNLEKGTLVSVNN